MRNLQKLFFLSLLLLPLSTSCTVTTSSGLDDDGGEGGDTGYTTATNAGATSAATGGSVATGGAATQATGGATAVATGGATATTPLYAATDCAASAVAAPPAYAADVTAACVACIYDPAKACTDAVACHNDATCVQEVFAALECVELYYQFGGDVPVALTEREACQNGDLAGTPAPGGSETMTIKAPSPAAWQGALVHPTGMTLFSSVVDACEAQCHLAIATPS